MTAPMITDATRASTAIVVYWRLTKASAPSRIVSATSTIACVPGIPGQDVARQVGGEQDRGDAGDRDDPVERGSPMSV